MLGAFGALISFVQMLAIEQPALGAFLFPASTSSSSASSSSSSPLLNAVYLAAFAVCMLVVYSSVPLVLRHSSATAMNLSFLTADFFSLGAAIALFGARLIALYFVAFVAIVGGVALYNMAEGGAELRDWWRRVRACVGAPPLDDEESERLSSSSAASASTATLASNHIEAATSGDSASLPSLARSDSTEQHQPYHHEVAAAAAASSTLSLSASASASSAAFEYVPLETPSASSTAIALSNREVLDV
jgi:hypothetical protein